MTNFASVIHLIINEENYDTEFIRRLCKRSDPQKYSY